LAESLQQEASDEGADGSADEGDDDGFGEELADHVPAAGSDGETDGEFAAAVCGAGGEDAREIGAGGEQDENRHEHDAEEKGAGGSAEAAAEKSGLDEVGVEGFVFRMNFRELASDGAEVVCGLMGSDAGLEASDDVNLVIAADAEVIAAVEV